MVIVGIDPGPTSCGWAEIAAEHGGRARFIRGGLTDDPLSITHDDADLWAVERPQYRPIGGRDRVAQSLAMAAALLETAWVAARIVGRLEELRRQVVTPTCGEVRRALVGRHSATDAEVKAALAGLVELPRTNCHVRDAVAVALIGKRIWELRQWREGRMA
jgi:Holliday junction resolvasome RuvABC endonuclease subunit